MQERAYSPKWQGSRCKNSGKAISPEKWACIKFPEQFVPLARAPTSSAAR